MNSALRISRLVIAWALVLSVHLYYQKWVFTLLLLFCAITDTLDLVVRRRL